MISSNRNTKLTNKIIANLTPWDPTR